ncbi:MAG: protein translocase subunit SecDF [Bacteroidales bacterium]|nr:protein translocase subunit SecDF [Bacteroidales bacterium]
MQSKGAIKFFAIAFALVCLYQLSFTFISTRVESKARTYAHHEDNRQLAAKLADNDKVLEAYYYDSIAKSRERYYLDSMSNQVVYNIGIRKYTFQETKERELNLGLDLKGGMNVTLEISVVDIIRSLSGNSNNPVFVQAIEMAVEEEKTSQKELITLFAESFTTIDPNASLAAIFINAPEFKDRIRFNSTNAEVISLISDEIDDAIDRSFNILRTRIDRFGVAQPNIQLLPASGRILVELPGIKEPERVRKLLQGTAQLEFWETYQFNEIANYFTEANTRLLAIQERESIQSDDLTQPEEPVTPDQPVVEETETTEPTAEGDQSLDDLLATDTTLTDSAADRSREEWARENPLFNYLQPNFFQGNDGMVYPSEGSSIGFAAIKDTARVNRMLRSVNEVFPRNLKMAWNVKPAKHTPDVLELVALKVTSRDGLAPLTGEVIIDARQEYGQLGQVEVSMTMNAEGARTWRRLTGDNIGRQIAIVLDGYVYSAPRVNDEIPTGRSSISGEFDIQEGQDLANILKSGKMPAPARIVQEEIVGPSLGREAISASLLSFLIAFILVLAYMIFYYNKAGLVADLALLANIFFILGVLASLGAVLTLPGIAGIVLTIGMAVDANVIIFERVREELRAGKGLKLAITDGYKNAYSAIIDGNVTTLLTGIVLYIFGSGPVQGFATTLIIGICSSLFTSIFLTRLIFNWQLEKNRKITFDNNFTRELFTNTKFDFLHFRKYSYIISASVIVIGLASLTFKGLNYGVDFTGGRTYVVRFDQNVSTVDVRAALAGELGTAPEVKTFGPSNQVKITTKYMIDIDTPEADSIVESGIYKGVAGFYQDPLSFDDFTSDDDEKILGRLSSQKIGPTVARDIKQAAIIAVSFALLIIFAYIAFRFKRWQYGVGAVAGLFHDSLIVISLYSIFYGILPFSLEVDQAFIAAILTIIGYSVNNTVVIFDRIRENVSLHLKRPLHQNINDAINSTLGRTVNTAGTTIVVLITIFIFGGEVIRGFAFALLAGIMVGTYSSWFTATPIAYDLITRRKPEQTIAKK